MDQQDKKPAGEDGADRDTSIGTNKINGLDGFLLVLIGLSVLAFSSYSLFTLMLLCGVPWWLSWVLSLSTDILVILTTRVWLNPNYTEKARNYAKTIAIGGFVLSVLCAGIQHTSLVSDGSDVPDPMHIDWNTFKSTSPEFLKFVVGSIPTAAFGFVVHLYAVIRSERARVIKEAELERAEERRKATEKAERDARRADGTANSKPQVSQKPAAKPAAVPVVAEPAASMQEVAAAKPATFPQNKAESIDFSMTRPDWLTDKMTPTEAVYGYLNRHGDSASGLGAWLTKWARALGYDVNGDFGRTTLRRWRQNQTTRAADSGSAQTGSEDPVSDPLAVGQE